MKPLFSILFFSLSFVMTVAFQTCAPRGDGWKATKPRFKTDPAFLPYIEEFEYYSKINTRAVPIRFFHRIFGNTAGVCRFFMIKDLVIDAYIEIDQGTWESITELQKINLIFHEFGHCIMGRQHIVITNYVETCPPSFMYDTVLSEVCLETHYNDYIKEMFPLWTE